MSSSRIALVIFSLSVLFHYGLSEEIIQNEPAKKGNLRKLDSVSAHWCHAFSLISNELDNCTPLLPSWVDPNESFLEMINPENLPSECQADYWAAGAKGGQAGFWPKTFGPIPFSQWQVNNPSQTMWHPICVVTTAAGLFRTPWMQDAVPTTFYKQAVLCGKLYDYYQCIVDTIQDVVCPGVDRHSIDDRHFRIPPPVTKGLHGIDCIECQAQIAPGSQKAKAANP